MGELVSSLVRLPPSSPIFLSFSLLSRSVPFDPSEKTARRFCLPLYPAVFLVVDLTAAPATASFRPSTARISSLRRSWPCRATGDRISARRARFPFRQPGNPATSSLDRGVRLPGFKVDEHRLEHRLRHRKRNHEKRRRRRKKDFSS